MTIIDCQTLGRGFYFHSGEDANSIVAGFTITNGSAGDAGGICCESSSPTMTNCTIIGNLGAFGGGIYCDEASPTIRHCAISWNLAWVGGGMYNVSCSRPVLVNCTFSGNSAQFVGGGMCNVSYSSPMLSNCTFSKNESRDGGGMYNNNYSSPGLTNCIFSGNSAEWGGGMYNGRDCTPMLTNCTFSGNSATNRGGGIRSYQSSHSTLTNCILWGNNDSSGSDESAQIYGTILYVNYCCIQGLDAFADGDNIGEDPNFWDANGLDGVAGTEDDDLRLSADSPCIDAGTNSPAGGLPPTDMEGNPRPLDGDSDGIAVADMGAFEFLGRSVMLEGLEITGPSEVVENSSAQYSATAVYGGDYTRGVTTLVIWSLEPKTCGRIDETGMLSTNRVETSDAITIYAHYTEHEVTVEAEMTVRVSPLVGLEIIGPQEVPANFQVQYNAIAHYGNGETGDVTDFALWRVEPPTLGEIDNGLLRAGSTDTVEDITLYAQYTAVGVTLETPKIVEIFPPRVLHVPEDYETIQMAIDDSNDGDTVLVSPGTYTGDGNRDIDFGGRAITVRSIDPNDPNIVAATIIDCNSTQTDPFEGHRGFYFHTGENGNSVLAGFTIINGRGSAIYCSSSPTIMNCAIIGNSATEGGGIACWGSSPNIINCHVTDNSAKASLYFEGSGGGISCVGGSPSITGCTISGNSAGEGGGILCAFSDPNINNCTIAGNLAECQSVASPWPDYPPYMGSPANIMVGGYGGGIYCWDSSPNISNCIISANQAEQQEGFGGQGGGLYNRFSNPMLTNCTFSENSAEKSGGGIANHGSDANVTNCTFSGNSAPNGSALACDWYYQLYPSSLQVANCILWDDGNEVWNNDGSDIVITYSDVKGGWAGEGNIDGDPRFAFDTDCHLMSGSACIDAGTNAPIGGLPATDMDGNPRALDGDEDGSPIADMGAYEYDAQAPTIALSVRRFQFTGIEGGSDTASQTLYMRNCGGQPLNWVLEGPYWLEAEPRAGSCEEGDVVEVSMWADPNGLSRGHYYGVVTISDSNATNNPQEIEVALQVVRLLSVPEQYSTIQSAIDAALDGDIVVVGPNTYTGEGNRDIDFEGKAITVRSTDPNDPNIVAATVIDCQGSFWDPHRGFYFHTGEGPDSFVSGLTITNGCGPSWVMAASSMIPFPHPPYFAGGGAIYCQRSSPTITKCIITGNSESFCGGGISCVLQGNPTITDCTIIGNSAGVGGGIYCDEASPMIRNCAISENTAAYGGGIYCLWYGTPAIDNCTISGNSAGEGGGILCGLFSSPTITNCTFSGNDASSTGGGMSNSQSNTTLINCSLTGNSAGHNGGGVYNGYSSNTKLTNCTFSGNSAPNGVAIACDSWYQQYPSAVELANCILWDGGEEIWNNDDSTITITYSCVQDADPNDPNVYPGIGNIDDDPCFVQPGYWADVNDPNIIVEPNDPNAIWVEGDYRLLPGSPCIDAGDNNSVPEDTTDLDGDGNTTELIPFDLDGELRFVDDPCTPDTGNGVPPIVDMGAFEFQLPDPIDLLLGLIEKVTDLNIQHGIANSLSAKLDAALKLLEDGNENNDVAALNLLQAFINAVEAQSGKKIPEADADTLIADALEIIDLAVFLEEWLLQKLSADVAPDGGDGIVNFLDWASFANEWESTTNMEDLAVFVDQWLQHSAY